MIIKKWPPDGIATATNNLCLIDLKVQRHCIAERQSQSGESEQMSPVHFEMRILHRNPINAMNAMFKRMTTTKGDRWRNRETVKQLRQCTRGLT